MDSGVNLPFNDAGIDPAEFGMPLWEPKWHKVIIVGSVAKALSDASKGGRLQFKIKNEQGQEHYIGLNIWHTDADTKARAERELASICHVVGKHQFNNTAELYNIPFYVLAENNTSQPTPQYPNPKPQTNFRGYRDINGNEPGKTGGAAPTGGPPANFGAAPAAAAPAAAPQPAFGQPAPAAAPAFAAPTAAQPAFGQPTPAAAPSQAWQPPTGAAPAPAASPFGAAPAPAVGGWVPPS